MGESWKAHVVRQGEYLRKLAYRFGVSAEELWSHPKNADLEAQRHDMDALCPGDLLFVPDRPREGLPLVKGTTNRFVAKVPTVPLKLRLRDGDTPLAYEPFVVHGLSAPLEGTTDGDGHVAIDLPVHIREITVELPRKRLKYHVLAGDMDCLGEDSGVSMRLQNLGFYARPSDPGPEARAEALRVAVLRFQRAQGLGDTGVVDDATRAALAKEHGS